MYSRRTDLLLYLAFAAFAALSIGYCVVQSDKCEARGGTYFPRDGVCLVIPAGR